MSSRRLRRKDSATDAQWSGEWLDADATVFVCVRQVLFEAGRTDAFVEVAVVRRDADKG